MTKVHTGRSEGIQLMERYLRQPGKQGTNEVGETEERASRPLEE